MFKISLICLILFAVGALGAKDNQNCSTADIKWIEQKLDHFNKSETKTWRMRYVTNNEFYKFGSPIFVIVNGLFCALNYDILSGPFYDLAKKHNAYLISTEHRYYGKSMPVNDLTTENLKYLSIKQALADLAHLIRTLKSTVPGMKNSKVILRGDEYGGSIAIWFKKLYPELATGCWASSAPVLAKIEIMEREIYGKFLRSRVGDTCYDRISNNTKKLEEMLTENKTAELRSLLNICENFDGSNELDAQNLLAEIYYALRDAWNQLSKKEYFSKVCGSGTNELRNFTEFLRSYLDVNDVNGCKDLTYQFALKTFRNSTPGDSALRPWGYQLCNEFGWFSTSSLNQPFGKKVTLKLYTSMCKDTYGDKFTPEYMQMQINKTNEYFGGLNPGVENVYLPFGEFDLRQSVIIQAEGNSTMIPFDQVTAYDRFLSENGKTFPKSVEDKFMELVEKWLQD